MASQPEQPNTPQPVSGAAEPTYMKLGKGGAARRLKQAERSRRLYEPDWFMNLAFFQGDQWVAWDGRGLYKPRVKMRTIITDNRVQPIVRTEVAKLTKARPAWGATPRQLDDAAVTDALAAVRLLEWDYDHFNIAALRRQVVTWSRLCGAGFVKTVWDSNIGTGVDVLVGSDGAAIKHPQTGKPLRPGEMPELTGIDGVRSKKIGGGDVEHSVRSPFDMYPDPLATSLEDARWIIEESVRSTEYVEERYGVRVAPDTPSQVGVVESRFHSHGVDMAAGEKVGVRVYELWERSSKSCPQGRRVVWCDGAEGCLYEGPNEYAAGLPYVLFGGIPVPGRFWPDAVVTHLRPIQARLNKLESQIAENASRFGNPAMLLDRLSGIEYSGVPGEQIRHNAVSPAQLPQYLSPPAMPNYVFTLVQQMEQSLKEISGQYEVSNGTVPAGVTAASAISLLQEQDATRLGPDVEAMEIALAKVGQQTIELQARYYTDERIVVIAGEDGITDVGTFRANESYQVPTINVIANSTFPRSLAAKQAAIRDVLNMLFQYGVPVDASALARTLRDMQVGGLERLVQSYSADVQQVSRENAEFLRSQDLVVREMDNHAAHVAGHKDFAKSARFLTLPDARQAVYVQHIRDHEMAMAALAAPMPGADPNAPVLPPGTVPTAPSGNPLPAQDLQIPPTQSTQ
jgi:hypothetical protein